MSQWRGFYLWLAQVLLLLGLTALMLWLSLRPKHPTYTIVNLYIPLSNDSSTNATAVFDLEIANPNKESGIFYDDIYVTLYFDDDDDVGTTTIIGSFYQGYSKTAHRTESVNLGRRLQRTASNKTMDLKVRLATKVRYKIWGCKSKHHGIDVQGKAPIGPDGKISGKKKKIKLHRTRKKWRLL